MTGSELVPSGASPCEFFLRLGDAEQLVTSATGPWKLIRAERSKLSQGELQLDLTLQREFLSVTKSFVIYPGSSVLRQWITIKNVGDRPLVVIDPGFLTETVRPGDPEQVDFHWMTGGVSMAGSWLLKTERLALERPRAFDSYESFRGDASVSADGVRAKVLHNGKLVWPASSAQLVADASVKAKADFHVDVAAGDRLAFVVNMNGNFGYDTTAFDPTIAYGSGETHTASREFSDKQGQKWLALHPVPRRDAIRRSGLLPGTKAVA